MSNLLSNINFDMSGLTSQLGQMVNGLTQKVSHIISQMEKILEWSFIISIGVIALFLLRSYFSKKGLRAYMKRMEDIAEQSLKAQESILKEVKELKRITNKP